MNLTDEQREALTAALAEVQPKLQAAFGQDCGIVLIAKPLGNEVVGVVANLPQEYANAILQYTLFTGTNVREHLMSPAYSVSRSMKPPCRTK